MRKFLSYKKQIDKLKGLSEKDRSDNDISKLIKLMENKTIEAYFYYQLTNIDWAPILLEFGLLNDAPYVEKHDKSVRFPIWYAGVYLESVAEKIPDVIISVTKLLKTDNPRAKSYLIKALLKLPPLISAEVADTVSEWIENTNNIDFFLHDLVELTSYWIEGEELEAGLLLFTRLFTPKLSISDAEKINVFYKVSPLIDQNTYWLEEVWESNKDKLLDYLPKELVNVFKEYLISSIEFEKELQETTTMYPNTSLWRRAIEEHPQNMKRGDLKNIYVDILRDSLMKTVQFDPSFVYSKIEKFVNSKWSILNRIAIYIMQFGDDVYDTEINQVFNNKEFVHSSELHHEYYWLLNKKFDVLNNEEKESYICYLEEKPGFLQKRALEIAEFNNREVTEEDYQNVYDGWWIRRIWAIRDFLDEKRKSRLNKIIEKNGQEPDYPDFTSWSTGDFQKVVSESPMSIDEINEISITELIVMMIEFEPEETVWGRSKSGFSETIENSVRNNPDKYLIDIKEFLNPEIPHIYQYNIIRAFVFLIENSKMINYELIFPLILFLMEQSSEDEEKSNDDQFYPNLKSVHREICSFLRHLFSQSDYRLSDEGLLIAFNIIVRFLDQPDEYYSERSNQIVDYVSDSINDIKGIAFHSLVNYMWYINFFERKKCEEKEQKYSAYIPQNILNIFNEKLDIEEEKSLAIRAVYGWRYAFLYIYNKDWVLSNRDTIFPLSKNMEKYWLAAWQGYILMSRFYPEIFRSMHPNYRKALKGIKESGNVINDINRRLSEHIMLAYISDEINFNSYDNLMQLFYSLAPADIRAHAVFWLKDAITSEENIYWDHCKALWEFRLDVAEKPDIFEDYSKEISEFFRWLKIQPMQFKETSVFIKRMIPYIHNYHNATTVIKYISKHTEEYPLDVIEILSEIRKIKIDYFFAMEEDGEIIKRALNSGNEKAISLAKDMLDFLAVKMNDFRWLSLIE